MPKHDAPPHEMSVSEAREAFILYVKTMGQYWASLPDDRVPKDEDATAWRVNGLAFSIMSALDGVVSSLPRFFLAPIADPELNQELKTMGQNWWPSLPPLDPTLNLTGDLHDRFES